MDVPPPVLHEVDSRQEDHLAPNVNGWHRAMLYHIQSGNRLPQIQKRCFAGIGVQDFFKGAGVSHDTHYRCRYFGQSFRAQTRRENGLQSMSLLGPELGAMNKCPS